MSTAPRILHLRREVEGGVHIGALAQQRARSPERHEGPRVAARGHEPHELTTWSQCSRNLRPPCQPAVILEDFAQLPYQPAVIVKDFAQFLYQPAVIT